MSLPDSEVRALLAYLGLSDLEQLNDLQRESYLKWLNRQDKGENINDLAWAYWGKLAKGDLPPYSPVYAVPLDELETGTGLRLTEQGDLRALED